MKPDTNSNRKTSTHAEVTAATIRVLDDKVKIAAALAAGATNVGKLAAEYHISGYSMSCLLDSAGLRKKRRYKSGVNGNHDGDIFLPAKLERAVRHLYSLHDLDFDKI